MTIVASRVEIEAPTQEMLKDPLAWFFAEHYRHRQVCQKLSEHAQSDILNIDLVCSVLSFLEADLPLHIQDEEEDLFPLLRRRCEPEDRFERTLAMLSEEHAGDIDVGKELVSVLKLALNENRGLGCYHNAKDIIGMYCTHQRRHIALENAVVLPIARLRLTKTDQKALSRKLAARRGLSDPFKESCGK